MIIDNIQEAWIADYVQYNTLKRQTAKTAFQKSFRKLLNNALFGKYLAVQSLS